MQSEEGGWLLLTQQMFGKRGNIPHKRFTYMKFPGRNTYVDHLVGDEKLGNVYRKVTLNKTKDVETEKKLNDHATSYTKPINDLSRELKLI